MYTLRRCRDAEHTTILAIINAAAAAYRAVIPPDRWHEPYMPREELDRELAAGVTLWGAYRTADPGNDLIGVMGIQSVLDVDLIRHAYVLPAYQRFGVGAALLAHLRQLSERRTLVGTWAAATWAIDFYRRHGFTLVSPGEKDTLLRKYWSIPERQIETSVVLVSDPRR